MTVAKGKRPEATGGGSSASAPAVPCDGVCLWLPELSLFLPIFHACFQISEQLPHHF